MWSLFPRKPCPICSEKAVLISQLMDDLQRERCRLSVAETRASIAVDALLQEKGKPSMTPPTRFSASDAEQLQRETFAFFKDEDDRGDGKIRDVDQLDFDRRTA